MLVANYLSLGHSGSRAWIARALLLRSSSLAPLVPRFGSAIRAPPPEALSRKNAARCQHLPGATLHIITCIDLMAKCITH